MKKQLSVMRQNDNIKEVRPEGGNQQLARGSSLPILDDKRHEATYILARLSKIANPYIQWKSFDRS